MPTNLQGVENKIFSFIILLTFSLIEAPLAHLIHPSAEENSSNLYSHKHRTYTIGKTFYILAGGFLKHTESKAECALRRILLYFQPASSGHLTS